MTIKICGIPYNVIKTEDPFDGTEKHFGQIDFEKAEIKINANLEAKVAQRTLIHEVTHGLLTGIGREDLSNDEVFVETLATAIDQTFKLQSVGLFDWTDMTEPLPFPQVKIDGGIVEAGVMPCGTKPSDCMLTKAEHFGDVGSEAKHIMPSGIDCQGQ